MSNTLMQTIPFIEARFQGKKQRPKSISVRLSGTTAESGSALGIANYWHSSVSPKESCHYVVDEELVFQCVHDDVCSKSNSERGVVCVNVCGYPLESADTWILEQGVVLEKAAELVAQLCWKHGIPARETDLITHRRFFKRGGIMIDVRGAWPTVYFFTLVRDYLKTYKEEGGL